MSDLQATDPTPNLTGVPETTLWTLHNRASEAARPDGCLRDPKCLEIYRALDYDYVRSFGRAEPSLALPLGFQTAFKAAWSGCWDDFGDRL